MRKLDPNRNYWFEPHATGFGYGPPTCWQGVVVAIVYCVLAFAPLFLIIVPWGRELPAIAWIVGNAVFWSIPFLILCRFKAPPINTQSGDVQLQRVKHRLAQRKKEKAEQKD
jgi:hypothetical protein